MPKRTHQRRPASEWMALFDRQVKSGLSQARFCQIEGVSPSSFANWKRRLRNEGGEASSVSKTPLFTPLRELPCVDSAAAESPEESHGSWTLDLDLGDGLRLTLRKIAGC